MAILREKKGMAKFLLLTSKDPWQSPTGGTSAFASQLLQVYKEEIAIASLSPKNFTPDEWILRNFNGTDIKYLYMGKTPSKKGFFPARLHFAFRVFRNNKNLRKLGLQNIFIDSPETVLVLNGSWNNLCYMFHGLNNPVSFGRYKLLQRFGEFFEILFLSKLSRLKPKCLLAAADEKTIAEFYERINYKYNLPKIFSFPTRVDNKIFYPVNDVKSLKQKLNISKKVVFTVTGRLAQVKGWDLILDAFSIFLKREGDAELIFVGDGEDRQKIEYRIKQLAITKNVRITGFINSTEVARYINVADLCLVGSHREGWSVAMCEMLACGKGIVSTDVSGVRSMIIEEKNGFIVNERNPELFCDYMQKALKLENRFIVSIELAQKYLVSSLKNDIDKLWIRKN
jgi:glycosyltransferase involved in cell wall biosynthesis